MAAHDFDRIQLNEVGRAPSATAREMDALHCAACGGKLAASTGDKPRRRFCSRTCQQRAYRRAHAAEDNARQRERRAQRRAELDVDTVPLSPEEEAMMAASTEEIARGQYVTSDELRARLVVRAVADRKDAYR